MAEFFLALDQGSHASRAIAFTPSGTLLDREQATVETTNPRPGWFEHDAEALLATVVATVERLLARQPAAACLGAGLATQRSSIVCWDRSTGEPLSPVISWRDTRHQQWLAGLDLDPARVHGITGLRVSAHYGASKLRWCLDHLAPVRAARDQGRLAWGPLASFLIFRLTRERTLAADPDNASR
ncbi:MAG: FGGY family carbohydrate kinase, partial [Gammaproteobacteria bacterium]